MVVVQRNEIGRIRVILILTVMLGAAVLTGVALTISGRPESVQLLLGILGVAALAAIALALIQLLGHPRRSQVVLFQREDEMVIATNAMHEGFKLRFLRDILGESVAPLRDEEREQWKALEADGFYATMRVRSVRKLIMLRLCTMIFDDVFYTDRSQRWEHHDSSSTSEPSFSKREMPGLKSWKMGA